MSRAFVVLFALSISNASAVITRDYAIELRATVQESPPRITLSWRNNGDGLQYSVQRKLKGATQWGSAVILPANSTGYIDDNVAIGGAYEYSVTKSPAPPFPVSGYIFAGIRAPIIESRGKIILLVDNTFTTDLATELTRLEQDLVGDGWTVLRRNVNRTASVSSIKTTIKNDFWADPANTRAVLIVGHLAVPYSGNYNADDHSDHTGAWVADTFYGDIDGTWTDNSVWNTSATRVENRNVHGDGKWDQSFIPSDIELEVGRVDLANLPSFSPKTEKDLLREYLNKNHNFRQAIVTAQRRGLIFDGFGESGGEAYAASGWRNFGPLFSSTPTEIGWDQFFPTIASQDYLWSYIAGGGDANYKECYGVGFSENFAATSVRTIFTMIFGSYFGDWDAPDDFMRAALASGRVLTAAWAGRPHWFFHHMALGETIGYSTRLSQNNSSLYKPTTFAREVHITLLGDPTLRMHPVVPPLSITATTNAGSMTLNWAASTDSNLLGYHIYRGNSSTGPFTRLNTTPNTSRTFSETVSPGTYTYMVRALKLDSSGSGTYTNISQGVFVTTTVPSVPNTPVNLSNIRIQGGQVLFRCMGQAGQRFAIDRSTNVVQWTPIVTNTLNTTFLEFNDGAIAGTEQRFYRTRTVP